MREDPGCQGARHKEAQEEAKAKAQASHQRATLSLHPPALCTAQMKGLNAVSSAPSLKHGALPSLSHRDLCSILRHNQMGKGAE